MTTNRITQSASVEAGVAAWAKRMGCGPGPDTVIVRPRAVMKRWKNHRGAEAVLWATDEGGHAWPGRQIHRYKQPRVGFSPYLIDGAVSGVCMELFF